MSNSVDIGQVVLEKKSKMEEVYRPIDGQTDRRRTKSNEKILFEFSVLGAKRYLRRGWERNRYKRI